MVALVEVGSRSFGLASVFSRPNSQLFHVNGTRHNILYFRGKRFCEFFLNGQGAKVLDVELYK